MILSPSLSLMSTAPLDGLAVALLATDGFEQSELVRPKKALEDAGATVHVVSPKSGEIKGWDEDDWGDTVAVDRTLADASADDYAALVLPGGQMNPDKLRIDEDAVAFTKAFFDAGKPVSAICHGPWLLVEAGVVEGRRVTSWPSVATDLKNAGADWVDQEVVRDEKGPNVLITSRKPDDLDAFNKETIETLAKVAQEA